MRSPSVTDGPYAEYTIMSDGTVRSEVHKMIGSGCTSATDKTEKALGIVTERVLKPEHSVKEGEKSKA